MLKLIYFHGFGSSGEGSTAKTLRELLNDWKVLTPDIQHYKNVVHFHGEHRLNRQVVEDVLVPLILSMKK